MKTTDADGVTGTILPADRWRRTPPADRHTQLRLAGSRREDATRSG